jgi:hypothetical protein
MPGDDWPLRCRHCNDRIGVYEPVYVLEGEDHVVAVSALELFADPQRHRSRVLHAACRQSADFDGPSPR